MQEHVISSENGMKIRGMCREYCNEKTVLQLEQYHEFHMCEPDNRWNMKSHGVPQYFHSKQVHFHEQKHAAIYDTSVALAQCVDISLAVFLFRH